MPEKPRPEPGPDTAPYWAGMREHRLLVQRCSGCQKLRHYPRPLCDHCYSFDHEWVELSGRGRVHSWTVSHHPFHPGFKRETPYTTVTIDLEEGVRLHAPLVGADGVNVHVGMRVLVDYQDIDAELTLPCCRPAR